MPLTFIRTSYTDYRDSNIAPALQATQYKSHVCFVADELVRTITPKEAERLMGFPDDWTAILYRGRQASKSARFRALGNSMAVPVMAWLGARIVAVDELMRAKELNRDD